MRAIIIAIVFIFTYLVAYNSGTNSGYAIGKCEGLTNYVECMEKLK